MVVRSGWGLWWRDGSSDEVALDRVGCVCVGLWLGHNGTLGRLRAGRSEQSNLTSLDQSIGSVGRRHGPLVPLARLGRGREQVGQPLEGRRSSAYLSLALGSVPRRRPVARSPLVVALRRPSVGQSGRHGGGGGLDAPLAQAATCWRRARGARPSAPRLARHRVDLLLALATSARQGRLGALRVGRPEAGVSALSAPLAALGPGLGAALERAGRGRRADAKRPLPSALPRLAEVVVSRRVSRRLALQFPGRLLVRVDRRRGA